ncbi:hypothetical protein AGDE_10645 [Angomonas deanei]|nr:hypothetical protein AGDE_10645 [Angomonas deanei]|eukprot:EPY27680.1 hypothetical protein AGDE_10645 [Angomonas deanei]
MPPGTQLFTITVMEITSPRRHPENLVPVGCTMNHSMSGVSSLYTAPLVNPLGADMTHSENHMTPELLKSSVERFWTPFVKFNYMNNNNNNKVRYDLNTYKFRENLDLMTVADPFFSCEVNNTFCLNKSALENLFLLVLSGFDIVGVDVNAASVLGDKPVLDGSYTLQHRRSFLGWKPTSEETITVPFSTSMEKALGNQLITHISLRTTFQEKVLESYEQQVLAKQKGDLEESRRLFQHLSEALQSPEALKMFCVLRRSNVSPNIISAKTLISATKNQKTWERAMGLQ